MLPAGAATEDTVVALSDAMAANDTVIDGGNTFWQDDIRRAKILRARDIHYVDVGTSGGVWGLERGFCLMIGGDAAIVERLDPIFRTLAPSVIEAGKHPAARRGMSAPPMDMPMSARAAPGTLSKWFITASSTA